MSTRKRAEQTRLNPFIRDPDKADYTCSATGCPLRATIFDSVIKAPHSGRCRYHDAAQLRDWPYLTEILRTHPFKRETLEPLLAGLGLRWKEPDPSPVITSSHCARTGITVTDSASFKRWWAAYKATPPSPTHPASGVLCRPVVGSFMHVGAIVLGRAPDEPLSEAELELRLEREAIRGEGA
jgi:hypothetical protein